MKKTLPSPKAPAAGHGIPGPFNKAGGVGLPLVRQEVRPAIFCEDVPRLLQPPFERSNQLRSRRP